MSDNKSVDILTEDGGTFQFMKPSRKPEDITSLIYEKMKDSEINVSLIKKPLINMEVNGKVIVLETKEYLMNDIDHGVKTLQAKFPSRVFLLEARREYHNDAEKTKVKMIIVSFITFTF